MLRIETKFIKGEFFGKFAANTFGFCSRIQTGKEALDLAD